MSLTENDRKVRSGSGKEFPGSLPTLLSDALRRDFGSDSAGVREVAQRSGANERAVKNWFDAKNAPNGVLLVRLMSESDEVLECVLLLAGREYLLKAKKIHDTRRDLLALLNQLHHLLE